MQACCAPTIETHLCLLLKNGRLSVDASEHAAETHGFSPKRGGWQVQKWTQEYVATRKPPILWQGCHAKVYSLLLDPTIAAKLQAYVHSNKWAMDPEKLHQFTVNKPVPDVANKLLWMKCLKASKNTWTSSCFLESTLRLAVASH